MADLPKFFYEGQEYELDFDDLTLDEVEEIEEKFDRSLEELDLSRAKVIKQCLFVRLKRDRPEITIEQLGAVRMTKLLVEPETSPQRETVAAGA